MTAVTFGFLIGGAVLVDTVFSWGGLGQYAVQSVINSDYAAVQGVVLVLAVINLFIYIIVDIRCIMDTICYEKTLPFYDV